MNRRGFLASLIGGLALAVVPIQARDPRIIADLKGFEGCQYIVYLKTPGGKRRMLEGIVPDHSQVLLWRGKGPIMLECIEVIRVLS